MKSKKQVKPMRVRPYTLKRCLDNVTLHVDAAWTLRELDTSPVKNEIQVGLCAIKSIVTMVRTLEDL